jgi:hypothetical protein
VDVAPTSQARVKVVAHDAAGNTGEDVSDGDFTIADGTPPEVTVTAPNGGETWDIEGTYDITWTATDDQGVTEIDILLSSDGGATYPHTIATGESNDGVYSWFVDVDATTEARVKVIAYDTSGNPGEDSSDSDFEIYDPASGIDPEREVPANLVIAGCTPNPFVETAEIRFGIPESGRARLDVFDVSGRSIAVITDAEFGAGYHTVTWNRHNGAGGTGLYFVRLRWGGREVTHKVVVSR